jgi:hypothetical protein
VEHVAGGMRAGRVIGIWKLREVLKLTTKDAKNAKKRMGENGAEIIHFLIH